MTDPENGAINANENVIGSSKLTSNNCDATHPRGHRSVSDERRFQDALEDDEVREALRVFHNRKP